MDLQSFLGNVFAGLASSVMTFFLVWLSRWYIFRRRYSRLNGRYHSYNSMSGERADSAVFEIKHKHGRIIAITALNEKDHKVIWDGLITMSEDVPEHGEGVYQYAQEPWWGIHIIQKNWKDGSIWVHGTPKSAGDGRPFAYVLKKLER